MLNTFERVHTSNELEGNIRDFGILLKNFGLSDLQVGNLSDKTSQFFAKDNSYADVALAVAKIVAEINPQGRPLSSKQRQDLYQRVETILG